jgi:hypothetical protein
LIFLATPHRGAQIAQLLNRVLQSIITYSRKQFVADLIPSSAILDGQQESFRHIAKKFKLMSFYETKPTPIGVKSIRLLGKDTSVMGYPDEVSRALDADHHHVCKFYGRMDPNYIVGKTSPHLELSY